MESSNEVDVQASHSQIGGRTCNSSSSSVGLPSTAFQRDEHLSPNAPSNKRPPLIVSTADNLYMHDLVVNTAPYAKKLDSRPSPVWHHTEDGLPVSKSKAELAAKMSSFDISAPDHVEASSALGPPEQPIDIKIQVKKESDAVAAGHPASCEGSKTREATLPLGTLGLLPASSAKNPPIVTRREEHHSKSSLSQGSYSLSASRSAPQHSSSKVGIHVNSQRPLRPDGKETKLTPEPDTAEKSGKRGIIAVEKRRESPLKEPSSGPGGGKRWSKEEDAMLRAAVASKGPQCWKQISDEFLEGKRSDVQCLHRWQKVLQPGLVKGPWTAEEDQIILRCVQEGNLKWAAIADLIPGRLGKQCRERWYNNLDPALKKGEWTEEEDRVLAEAQAKWGNAWTKIARSLPGRSENAVKNRWNSSTRRREKATGRAATKKRDLGDQESWKAAASYPSVRDPPAEKERRGHGGDAVAKRLNPCAGHVAYKGDNGGRAMSSKGREEVDASGVVKDSTRCVARAESAMRNMAPTTAGTSIGPPPLPLSLPLASQPALSTPTDASGSGCGSRGAFEHSCLEDWADLDGLEQGALEDFLKSAEGDSYFLGPEGVRAGGESPRERMQREEWEDGSLAASFMSVSLERARTRAENPSTAAAPHARHSDHVSGRPPTQPSQPKNQRSAHNLRPLKQEENTPQHHHPLYPQHHDYLQAQHKELHVSVRTPAPAWEPSSLSYPPGRLHAMVRSDGPTQPYDISDDPGSSLGTTQHSPPGYPSFPSHHFPALHARPPSAHGGTGTPFSSNAVYGWKGGYASERATPTLSCFHATTGVDQRIKDGIPLLLPPSHPSKSSYIPAFPGPAVSMQEDAPGTGFPHISSPNNESQQSLQEDHLLEDGFGGKAQGGRRDEKKGVPEPGCLESQMQPPSFVLDPNESFHIGDDFLV